MTTPNFRWIETNAWQLDFFALPHRVPWAGDAPEPSDEVNFELDGLLTGCEALVENEPNVEGPWKAFVAAGAYFDDMTEALEDQEFARAAELLTEIEKHHVSPFSSFHKAFVARQTGRDEEAVRLYVDVVNKAPNLPFAWDNLGTVLAENGQRDKAIEAFSRAVQINANDTVALEALVQLRAAVKVLKDQNDPKSAVYLPLEKFREAAIGNIEPLCKQPEQLVQFGQMLLREGLIPDVGLQALEKARELLPEDAGVWSALAMGYRGMKQPEKSKEAVTRFTELRPEDPWGFVNLAQILLEMGDKAGCSAALKQALEIEPNIQPALAAYFELAENKGDVSKEQELVAFGKERNAWMPLLLASGLARDRDDIPNAVKYAAEAYEVNPKSEEVLLHYCAMLGDAKDAETLDLIMQPALTGGNYSKRLNWNYAQCLRQVGKEQQAVEVLEQALRLEGPEDFKTAAETTIDFWTGRRAQGNEKLEIHPSGSLLRPVLLSLADGDGGILLQPRERLPAFHSFKARVNSSASDEARVSLQQGQTGFAQAPKSLGTFVVKNVQPTDGEATTVECKVDALPDGRVTFGAIQNGVKLPVEWVPAQN